MRISTPPKYVSAVVSQQQSLSGEIFSLTNSTFNLRSPSQLSSALFPNPPKQSVTMEKIDSLAGAGNPLAGKIFKLEQRAKKLKIVPTAVWDDYEDTPNYPFYLKLWGKMEAEGWAVAKKLPLFILICETFEKSPLGINMLDSFKSDSDNEEEGGAHEAVVRTTSTDTDTDTETTITTTKPKPKPNPKPKPKGKAMTAIPPKNWVGMLCNINAAPAPTTGRVVLDPIIEEARKLTSVHEGSWAGRKVRVLAECGTITKVDTTGWVHIDTKTQVRWRSF
ncbi:hypothetical protein ScalyP_jg466 [Parmales sp. scaly parma]|nr:hypothetical protein ScalyP_jg466 [Parmales sp. scaly parma]